MKRGVHVTKHTCVHLLLRVCACGVYGVIYTLSGKVSVNVSCPVDSMAGYLQILSKTELRQDFS